MLIKIISSNYPFSKGKDRFISSNKFFTIDRNTIDKCKILDTLNKEDKLRIYNKIQESPKISTAHKLLSKALLS